MADDLREAIVDYDNQRFLIIQIMNTSSTKGFFFFHKVQTVVK